MSNTISFIGRVGKDSVLKTVKDSQVLEFSVANTQGFGDKKTTIWFNCHQWGKSVEKLQQYIIKGSQIFVSGELTLRTYTKDGVEKTSAEIRVDKIDLIGSKDASKSSNSEAPYEPKTKPGDGVNTDHEMPF